jgi:hypothetical protein
MYYATFFAATSLMGLFGAWKIGGNRILDVASGTPGSQQLVVRRYASTFSGSHQSFWDYFYLNASSLDPLVEPTLRFALVPISGSVTWLIDNRNDVNYDSHGAFALMAGFGATFRRSKFPASLPGAINTQFQHMEAMIRIAAKFSRDLGINTDAVRMLGPSQSRRETIRRLVYMPSLPLGRLAKRKGLIV